MDTRFADAVIVAAGASARMGGADSSDTDKMDAELLGRPISLVGRRDGGAPSVDRVIVVTRPIGSTSSPERTDARREVVAGGEHRSDSVRAGVAASSGRGAGP